MNINELSVENFCSNCLMGVTGSVANYKYNIKNINKLYFHHSYVYQKQDKVDYDIASEGLNVWFSRELPISKEDFSKRLLEYYELGHCYKTYADFEKMLQDISKINQSGELVMIEIDCYYMKKHRFYHKVHDQHMMIIYGIDFNKKCLNVFEPIFGHIEFEWSEYKDYFDDVMNNRNREIITLILMGKFTSNSLKENKINLKHFTDDIDKTLVNLSQHSDSTTGIGALKEFKKDLLDFLQIRKDVNNFFIPGMWSFMCDAMNCANFIDEFQKDYPDFPKENVNEVKNCCILLNRKWYDIFMGINEVDRHKISDYEETLNTILNSEEILYQGLTTLKKDISEYLK